MQAWLDMVIKSDTRQQAVQGGWGCGACLWYVWESVFPVNSHMWEASPHHSIWFLPLVLRMLWTPDSIFLGFFECSAFIAASRSPLLGRWEDCWFYTQVSLWLAGYVCERKDLLANGCCNVNVPGTKQYCCDGCLSNGCCGAYEHCVSCCLQPNKVWKLLLVLHLHLSFCLYLMMSVEFFWK